MRIRIKPLICVMLCLAVVFASHTILSTHSRYVLDGVGELLRSIITGPKLTVTYILGEENGETVTYVDEVEYNDPYTINSTIQPIPPQGDYGDAEITFDGWMNAAGIVIPNNAKINITRSIVLNPKWSITNYINLIFLDYEGNVLMEKHYPQGMDPLTANERLELDAEIDRLNSDFNNQYAEVGLNVTVSWSGPYDSSTLKAATEDLVIRQSTKVSMSTGDDSNKANIQLEPQEDANGDGFPDSYIVVGVVEDDNNIHIDIPDYVLGSPVVEITDGAFGDFDNITTIKIPVTITYIGEDAFANKETGTLGILKYEQMTFLYEGTYAQWQAVEKDPNWDRYVGKGSRIYFLEDGTYIEETAGNGTWNAKDREWSSPQTGTYSG